MVYLMIDNNRTIVLNCQDAREISPEEQLSSLDQQGIQEMLNRVTTTEVIREYVGDEEHIDDFKDAVIEDARTCHKRFLDFVRWHNDRHPDNHITIPSEASTVTGWLARPVTEVQWDIEQLMAQGTTLIRLGGMWHGLQVRQLMPICVNLELTENQMQTRIRKLAGIYPAVRDINFLARKGANYRINTDEGKENLFELLRNYGQSFGVVILDPLALFIDGKLEKIDWNGEVEPVLTELKQEFGCSIILNHNFRKKIQIYGHGEDMFAPDRLKGVADIIDRVDNIVVFVSESQPRKNEQGENQRIEIAKWIHAAKTRDAERALSPHRVKWIFNEAMFVPVDELGWALPANNIPIENI